MFCEGTTETITTLSSLRVVKSHRLGGAGCKQRVCIHNAGQIDAVRKHWAVAYEDYWLKRRSEHRSTEQLRKYGRLHENFSRACVS